MAAREICKRKRASGSNNDLLLPESKRRKRCVVPHLLELPTELLDHIVEYCDQNDVLRLACTCTMLHCTVTRFRGYDISLAMLPEDEQRFDRLIMSCIHPLANRLRARPWWTPAIVTITVDNQGPTSSSEQTPEQLACMNEFTQARLMEILDHVRKDVALLGERSSGIYLTIHLSKHGQSVIHALNSIIPICTSVAVSCPYRYDSICKLTTKNAYQLAQCGHVSLFDCTFSEPESAYRAFQTCSCLILAGSSSVTVDIVQFLRERGVVTTEI